MNKNLLFFCLGLGLLAIIVVICLKVLSPSPTPATTSTTPPTTKPTSIYKENICSEIKKKYGPCKIVFLDMNANLVFNETNEGVMPILTNEDFTKIKKAYHPLDFVEYKEENAPLSWQENNYPKDKFSMLSGFANNNVKIIIIDSEENVKPKKKILIRDNLWLWYMTFNKAKVSMPIKVTAFDAKGKIIFGEKE